MSPAEVKTLEFQSISSKPVPPQSYNSQYAKTVWMRTEYINIHLVNELSCIQTIPQLLTEMF